MLDQMDEIEEETYRVYDQQLPETQSIACPGLADMISSDVSGTRIIENIRLFLSVANPQLSQGKVIVVLGCTHYGGEKIYFWKLWVTSVLSHA